MQKLMATVSQPEMRRKMKNEMHGMMEAVVGVQFIQRKGSVSKSRRGSWRSRPAHVIDRPCDR